MIIYFFNSFSKDIEINDLIMNEKKIKKKEDKEMNTLSCVKLQNAHCLFKHKTQAETVKASFQNLNSKEEDKALVITS